MNAIAKTPVAAERQIAEGITVTRVEANLGAQIHGIDFAAPISVEIADLLRNLLWEHQVLFFRGTGIDDEKQQEIGRIFGEPVADSIRKRFGAKDDDVSVMNTGPFSGGYYGTYWHADATYLETPYQVSILRSVIAPELGGDTAWSSAISVYDSLSPELQERLGGLTATHRPDRKTDRRFSSEAERQAYLSEYNGVVHPVIITHPFTGKKAVYVNEGFTHEIIGLAADESDQLLKELAHNSTG